MFNNIVIHNFRGIKSCVLANLGLINLFFGKNNCGKTSLLESMLLLADPSNPTLPVLINNQRNLLSFSEDDILVDFYGATPTNKIQLECSGGFSRKVEIEMIEEEARNIPLAALEHDTETSRYGYRISFVESGKKYFSELLKNDGTEGNIHKSGNYKEKIHSRYIPSGSLLDKDLGLLEEVFKRKEEKKVLTALQIVEPRIKDIQLSGKKLMVDVGLDTRLPINVMGDGVRRVLALILSILSCKDGVLMIDELDNGLHHSVMSGLWKVLIRTAQANNVQLFVSTHSKDMLTSLVEVIQEKQEPSLSEISAFKLLRKEDDTLVALRYDAKELSFAMEQNMEVR